MFRWYAAAFAAQAAAVIVVAVHLVPFLREHGHSATFAAVATGALGALSVSGRLVLTAVVRRVPVAVVAATMFVVQGLGVLVLLVAGSTTWGAVVFVLLFGLGFGVGTIARRALLAESFGTARYATLVGLLGVVTTVASTAGPVAAGAVRTATGSYTGVLVALVVVCVLAAGSLTRAARCAVRAASHRMGGRMLCQSKVPMETMTITATTAAVGMRARTSPNPATRMSRNTPARNVEMRSGRRRPSR